LLEIHFQKYQERQKSNWENGNKNEWKFEFEWGNKNGRKGENALPYNGRGYIDINSSHDVNRVLGVMSLQKKFQGFYKCEHNQSGYQFHWPFLHLFKLSLGGGSSPSEIDSS
jgi:hypothetical protein